MKLACLILPVLVIWMNSLPLHAGAVIASDNAISVGEVTEDGESIMLKMEYGRVKYNRSQLLWYTTDPRVVNVISAAAAASREEAWGPTRLLLLETIAREPTNRALAEKMLDKLSKRLAPAPAVVEHPVANAEPAASTDEPAEDVITRLVADELVVFSGGDFTDIAKNSFTPRKYYAIYTSAHWCPPCRGFTPKLVKFYTTMQESHGQLFDVIFCSRDKTGGEMATYMDEFKMPWPAIRYNKRFMLKQYAANAIPCLVIVDGQGEILAHSYPEDGPRIGASAVLEKLRELLDAEK